MINTTNIAALLISLTLGLSQSFAAENIIRLSAPVSMKSGGSTPTPDLPASLTLSAGLLPDAMIGKPYSFDLSPFAQWTHVKDGEEAPALSWSSNMELPTGLLLSEAGEIQGTPAEDGTSGFEVIATHVNGEGRRLYTLKVGTSTFVSELISTGSAHTCAKTTEGSVKCWGLGTNGQIGDGTTSSSLTPKESSGLSNAIQLSSGVNYSCAVSSNGSVWCWGINTSGNLGDGGTTRRLSPVAVSNINNASSVSTGNLHTCAILKDGTGRCWGENSQGQLGNGLSTDSRVPVDVEGLSGATQISSSSYAHSCALISDGSVKCWGSNGENQSSDSATSYIRNATAVNGITNARQVKVGYSSSCAIINEGKVKCWGNNSDGQLGNGTKVDAVVPVEVSGLNNISQIAVGHYHACALISDGTVKCWGRNTYGQLGNDTLTLSSVPVAVIGLNDVQQITAGANTTCAKLSSGEMKCWGLNSSGQLGTGDKINAKVPISVSP